MLPIFTPNRALAAALYAEAKRTDSLRIHHLADLVKWAADHYGVDGHVHPLTAAADAAGSIAATIRNNERFDDRANARRPYLDAQ